METDALDRALARLQRPSSTEERLELLGQLTSYWLGRLKDSERRSPLEITAARMPDVLRRWYETVGRRGEVFGTHRLMYGIAPADLAKHPIDGKIQIFFENQGVYLWATSPEGDDPPVWGKFNEPSLPWQEESPSLTEFLIGYTLNGYLMTGPYGGSASWVPRSVVDRVAETLPELPLRAWNWPARNSRFYGAGGAFMFAAPNGESEGVQGYSVFVGSKRVEHVAFLKEIVDDAWESTYL